MKPRIETTNPVLDFLRRRWLLIAAVSLVTAVGAWIYAGRTAAQTYSASATMLYNRSQLGAPHYQQPEPQTIVGLFRSRGALETLAREFNLPPNVKLLSQSVHAEVVFGSNTIQLSMQGDDAKRTQAELDRLMQLVIEQAAALRRASATQILDGLQQHLAEARSASDRAFEALRLFNSANGIATSVDDDLESIHDDIAAIERMAETDRPSMVDPNEALQRRRTALLDRINHERDSISRNAALELKKNEFERAKRLHDKRFISDGEFRRVEAEYNALAAQNHEALRSGSERVAELDRQLASRMETGPANAANAAVDPAIALSVPPSDATQAALVARLKVYLEQRRGEMERLNGLRSEAAKLEEAVAAAQGEVRRASTSIASYEELRDAPYHDLMVIQPAAPALDPVVSNKKKLFAGAWLASICFFVAPLFVWDLSYPRRRMTPLDNVAKKSQCPILASVADQPGDAAVGRREVIRTLALRLQQVPSKRGIVAAMNALNEVAPPTLALLETAECLRRRGEHVLIVDVTGDAATSIEFTKQIRGVAAEPVGVVEEWIATPGLFRAAHGTAVVERATVGDSSKPTTTRLGFTDLLTDHRLSTDAVARSADGFDVITFGDAPLPEEAFASRRLTALLDEWRSQYGVVLLSGPGVTHGVDLEMLSARVDALVFVVEGRSGVLPAAERTMTSLATLRAPVLGTVQL